MDTILLVTMILLTPLTGIWAFILSESRVEGTSPEDIQDLGIDDQMQKDVPGYAPTPEQEAVSALNRIWDIWLRPEGQLLEKKGVAYSPDLSPR
jgi:hypothetical protein